MTVVAAEALGSRDSPAGSNAPSGLAVPGSRATTYTARVVNSAAEINQADWQQVCTGTAAPVFMDLRFVEAVEQALKDGCRFWFVIVYAGKAPVACAGLTAMTVDFTDFGDRRITWLIKYNPLLRRFRNMKMLFCSLPGSPGDRSIAFSAEADSRQVLTLLDDLMVNVATEAGLDAVVFKEFAPTETEPMNPLLDLGYLRVEVPAMHLLDPAFATFADYTAALRTRYRQQVNKSTRKLKGSGIVSTVLTDPDEILRRYTEDTHAMYREMTLKSDLRVEVLPFDYYRELVRRMPQQVELIALIKDDRLIAFGWCLFDATTYHMMYAGLDYRLNKDFDLYFNLMYAGFDRALRRGVARIHVGQTATVFKSRMGCFSEERYIYTKGIGFFMSRLFRYGSSLLVVKKPSNPPSDIFKRQG
jgi:predicted N-acyltransferase